MEIAKFPIYRLENRSGVEIADEEDGRFYKYWTNQTNLGRCLFKAAFPYGANPKQHRMDWREKVAGELGQLLGLPMARTELAKDEQQSGNFAAPRLMESCWWETQIIDDRSETIEITTIRALEIAVNIRPSAAAIWLERLRQINLTQVVNILSCIPADLITLNETRFSIELLEYNRQQILNFKLRSSESRER